MTSQAQATAGTILVISDDSECRSRIASFLEFTHGCRFAANFADDAEEGVAAIADGSYACVILDSSLAGNDVLDHVAARKRLVPPIIVLIDAATANEAVDTVAHGAQDYLVKGEFGGRELLRCIRNAIQRDVISKERNGLLVELQEATAMVQSLRGIHTMCSHCRKLRNEEGKWIQLERYIMERSQAVFSHGICPECIIQYYGELIAGDLPARSVERPPS